MKIIRFTTAFGLAALLTSTLASVGCDSKTAPSPEVSAETSTLPSPGPGSVAKPAAAEKPEADAATANSDDGLVIARVDDVEFTADRLKAALRKRSKRSPLPADDALAKRVLDQMVNKALIYTHAKSLGFTPKAADGKGNVRKQAANFVHSILRKEAEGNWKDSAIEKAFVERRELRAIVVPTRPEAAQLQQTLLAAIKAKPDNATQIFNDFAIGTAKKLGLRPNKKSKSFDAKGQTLGGEQTVPTTFASVAFALKAAGDVAPPVPVLKVDGQTDSWAVIQLRRIRPATAAADRKGAVIAKAKHRLLSREVRTRRKALLEELHKKATIVIDEARVANAVQEVVGTRQARPMPFDLQKWRRHRLRGAPEQPKPGVVKSNSQLQQMGDEEVIRRMGQHAPADSSPASNEANTP